MFEAGEPVQVNLGSTGRCLDARICHATPQFLLLSCNQEESALLKKGASLQLVQAIQGGLYEISTVVLNCQNGYFAARRERPRLVTRRRRPRLLCDLPARYVARSSRSMPEPMDLKSSLAGRVRDISGGGVRLDITSPVPDGATLTIWIELRDEEWICSEASVIRCKPVDGEQAQFSAALRFGGMPRMHHVLLQRYLLERSEESVCTPVS